MKQETSGNLKKYHKANPLKAGMPKEELKSKYPSLSDPKIFNLIVNQMIKDGEIVQEEKTVRLKEHTVSLGTDQALANAPDRDNEFFKVPKILDDNSGA